ncbi:MAG: ATP-binding protein [Oscillospiraceae bacterium]|nr:ATP-binding protein [Oscillospiraceae bacterium]
MKEYTIKFLVRELLSLSVYRELLKRPAVSLITDMLCAFEKGDELTVFEKWGCLCNLAGADGYVRSLPQIVADEVLSDQNAFTQMIAAGKSESISDEITLLAKRDLDILYRAATNAPLLLRACLDNRLASLLPPIDNAQASPPLNLPWDKCIGALIDYHFINGVGVFTKYTAFVWQNCDIKPVVHPDPIRLNDLKGYESQRSIAIENTLSFLDGYEANNMLLYGDRGTGKSSTVKALLNEYSCRGLRMVEIPKESLNELAALTERLAAIPMKFIVFIDDLSFSGNDDSFSALKAVLEGGLSARPKNVLVYATSNRRHLVRENFGDRGNDDIHREDTLQETVSLSDRFGIILTFLLPDKKRFLEIIELLAADRGLEIDRKTLLDAAERYALERGARSPRFARQFIAQVQARIGRNKPI